MLVESVGMYAIRFIIILSYLYTTDCRLALSSEPSLRLLVRDNRHGCTSKLFYCKHTVYLILYRLPPTIESKLLVLIRLGICLGYTFLGLPLQFLHGR